MRLDIESTVSSPVATDIDFANSVDVSKLLKQGVAAAQSGDRPMARTLLSNVTEADPSCVDAWLWLASISEYPEELLVFLKRVLDIEPENERALTWESATRSLLAKTHVQRGIIANEEGNHSFAIQSFNEAIAFDDRCDSAWYWKASLAEEENDKLDFLARVLAIDPEHADAKDAVKAIEQARASAKMLEAKKASAAGDFELAASLIAEINAAEPENCEAWVLRAHVVRSFEEKFDAYERILQLDPLNEFAQYGHNFLAELAESVKPVEMVEVEEPAAEPQPEPVMETVAEEPWPSVSEPEAFDAGYSAEPEHAEGINSDPVVEEQVPEQNWAAPFADEPVTHEIVEEAIEDDPWNAPEPEYHADEQVDTYVAFETAESVEEQEVIVEQPIMAFDHDYEAEIASRDTADSIDPFAEVADKNEPASMVAEEAAREADSYASPTAETQEFRAEEHEFEEIIASGEPSEYIDDTEVPSFYSEPETFAPPAPWEAPEIAEQPVAQFEAVETAPELMSEPAPAAVDQVCPYCAAAIDRQAFSCVNCLAVLSLSDIESLLANNSVNFDVIQRSVARMEADWNSREFSTEELKSLGIGQFNLKNFELGFAYIQEASRQEPNDVILAGQLNALAIRLGEIKRQDEIKESMPKGKTILVVDDSPTVRKLISSKLEKSGHQVICAVDGVEAMATMETMVPDLVLLDIAMPRMDGYQVCKLIRANDSAKDVPVVMISGKDGFFDKVRGRMAGTTGYITKPFGPETLMKALETYLIPDSAPAE